MAKGIHLPALERIDRRERQILALSPDGQTLAFAGERRGITLWDVANDEPRDTVTLDGQVASISALGYSPRGSWFVVVEDRGKASLQFPSREEERPVDVRHQFFEPDGVEHPRAGERRARDRVG